MIRLITLFILSCLSVSALADIDSYKKIKGLEATIESQIRSELSTYTKRSFNVQVKIFVKKIETTSSAEQDAEVLPGLYKGEENGGKDSQQSRSTEIDHIDVKIILDQAIDPSIDAIARSISIAKADLSARRGDRVIITRKALDLEQDELIAGDDIAARVKQLGQELENIDANLASRQNSFEDSIDSRIKGYNDANEVSLKKVSTQTATLREFSIYSFVIFACAFLLFSYLAFVYFSSSYRKLREQFVEVEKNLRDTASEYQTKLDDLSKHYGFNKDAENDSMISDLTTLAIARKNGFKAFLRSCAEEKSLHQKVAIIVHVLGIKSVSMLLSKEPDTLEKILQICSEQDLPLADIQQAINDIYEEIKRKTDVEYQVSNAYDEFAFIRNMNEQQVLLLMEGEDIGIQAFILTQVDKSLSAQVLSRLESQERLKIILELGNMNAMDSSTYGAIARKLSSKIETLPAINHFVVSGESEMAEHILRLKASDQIGLLEMISTQNSDLYKALRQNYYFADDINKLADEQLKVVLINVNGEAIASTLYQLDSAARERLLKLLPERKMVLLQERLTQFKSSKPDDKKLIDGLYTFLESINQR